MDEIKLTAYVIDFERVKELTDNGLSTDTEGIFNGKIYTTVNSMIIDKMLKEYLNYLKQNRVGNESLSTNFEIILKTLIHNKILIKPRVQKIQKILENG